ncbi:MAG: NADH-ubiquinone oxidoreductase-F iron-sulfur binding region domain-containing protein [Gemmataceae bacterium]|jgi:NADH:ubiquinone oxidoreductase subunit F (NADH-binding)/NADH:ubiquinone oxidoreductase subunit E
MIVQGLQEIQKRCGYISPEEMRTLAEKLEVPLHRVHEVATFYPLYRLSPPKGASIRICRDMACHTHGAENLIASVQALADELGKDQLDVCGVSCLGQCDRTVAAIVNDHHVICGQNTKSIVDIARKAAANEPFHGMELENSPLPFKINIYGNGETYGALKKYVQEGQPADELLKRLEISNLRGMGGAGFPTFKKWSAVRSTPSKTKYVICNADESEPGTFKDREILRRAPWLVIEGMILAAFVSGAEKGYLYIRHEYIEELHQLEKELAKAQKANLVGKNILGTGKDFHLEIYVSPGGYVQGEETALMEAIEDRRGEPRNKPPFSVFQGLFGKPTVINNVETLAWTPGIFTQGGEWYRDMGIRGARGMRLVSISGDVVKPGVYEVPFGQTVKELIFETAGGLEPGRSLKAIATSGPSGGFLPAQIPVEMLPQKFVQQKAPSGEAFFDVLTLALDLDTLALMGGMLGAAFIVYDDRRDMVDNALNCVSFYRNESCGKCVPCRTGSQKLVDMITDLMHGKSSRKELELISDLGETMGLTSICGLGQVASNPITSVIKFFPKDVSKHLEGTSANDSRVSREKLS